MLWFPSRFQLSNLLLCAGGETQLALKVTVKSLVAAVTASLKVSTISALESFGRNTTEFGTSSIGDSDCLADDACNSIAGKVTESGIDVDLYFISRSQVIRQRESYGFCTVSRNGGHCNFS